jgi:hypothetical protein
MQARHEAANIRSHGPAAAASQKAVGLRPGTFLLFTGNGIFRPNRVSIFHYQPDNDLNELSIRFGMEIQCNLSFPAKAVLWPKRHKRFKLAFLCRSSQAATLNLSPV